MLGAFFGDQKGLLVGDQLLHLALRARIVRNVVYQIVLFIVQELFAVDELLILQPNLTNTDL